MAGGHSAASTAPERLELATHDLFAHVRRRRPEQLLLFVVDTSGSMGGVLTGYARAMATAALRDAYLKRATVALVVFRERSAELVLPATRKVDRLHAALDALPFGGTTPLAAALELARRTIVHRRRRDATTEPTLVLVSDGRANVGSRPGHERILAEVSANARALAALRGLAILFLDTTEAGKDDGPARALADWLGAERVVLAGVAGRAPHA